MHYTYIYEKPFAADIIGIHDKVHKKTAWYLQAVNK